MAPFPCTIRIGSVTFWKYNPNYINYNLVVTYLQPVSSYISNEEIKSFS
jgi:hypothetical protein